LYFHQFRKVEYKNEYHGKVIIKLKSNGDTFIELNGTKLLLDKDLEKGYIDFLDEFLQTKDSMLL
jgi:hypothetical protein